VNCEPTLTPDDIDISALREKYRQERDKRLRCDGQKQYVKPNGDWAAAFESDPYRPLVSRDPISEDLDIAILGAGWSGILSAYHLKQVGVDTFRNIDTAGDFGGTWYWNRYPGLQCDNDSYCYLPLLEEMGFMPSKKFADGWEIYEYCRRIAKRFDLYKRALFHTQVTAVRWDDAISRWRIATNRGDDIRALFVIMAAGGLFNVPKLPGIPGMETFKGHMFHTARWDYNYTGGDQIRPMLDKLADKTVAIVGTGASAVQVIPYLGRHSKQLYVLQRTPSSVDERHNPSTNPEWVQSLKPGWQKARQANFQRAAWERFARYEPDLVCDIWTELSRNLAAKLEAQGWPELTPERYLAMREVEDYRVMERLRRRVDSMVGDKETAEALKPWYRFFCKRPCSNNEYYPTFNRPNVKLIDVSTTKGVERITEKGFLVCGVEYEIDCMILASGFEVSSDLDRRWGIEVIEGRNGVSIYDHWADGCRTLHGMMSHGFPNQFFTGLNQGGLNASVTELFSRQAYHIAYIIRKALARGITTVEPSAQAQDAWVEHIRATAVDLTQFQRECTPGYFNSEGEQRLRWYLGESYGPGWDAFERLVEDWRHRGDMDGLTLT
jgi:cation diffusion facilitator CzcD-associated flavoprotein CzcO